MKHVTRRGVVGAATVALAGCFTDDEPDGDSTSGDGENENPALESALDGGALQVRSPAFEDGESIPGEYGREEADVNPPLEISGVPDGAGTLALVADDPDAVEVAGEIFVHWLVWNIPPETTSIPEDWSPETAVEGENDSARSVTEVPRRRTRNTHTGSNASCWTARCLSRRARPSRTSAKRCRGAFWHGRNWTAATRRRSLR